MSYSLEVCTVSSRYDSHVSIRDGEECDVVAEMAEEQGETEDYILENFTIEEHSIEVPEELQRKIYQAWDLKSTEEREVSVNAL